MTMVLIQGSQKIPRDRQGLRYKIEYNCHFKKVDLQEKGLNLTQRKGTIFRRMYPNIKDTKNTNILSNFAPGTCQPLNSPIRSGISGIDESLVNKAGVQQVCKR